MCDRMRKTRKGYSMKWYIFQEGLLCGPAITYYRDSDVQKALFIPKIDESLNEEYTLYDFILEIVKPYRVVRQTIGDYKKT